MHEKEQWFTRFGVLSVVSELPKQNRHRVVLLTCSICSTDAELWPTGSIRAKVIKLNRGARPCGCSTHIKWKPWQNLVRAKRGAARQNLIILENRPGDKVLVSCGNHAPFEKALKSLACRGTGCPDCWYESLRLCLVEKARRIAEREAETGLKVWGEACGFLTICCPTHGLYRATLDTFVRQRCGCPSCASGGFKPHRDAALYVLKSECGGYLKVGISGDLGKRIGKLEVETPFRFKLDCFRVLEGFSARAIEKRAHLQFESAGLNGFDGSTEWLKANPSIRTFVLTALP